MKKRLLRLCALALLCLCLTHCGVETSLEPSPLPDGANPPQIEVGESRILNAESLDTVVSNGTAYVAADQLAAAMHMACTVRDGKAHLTGLPGATCFARNSCDAEIDGAAVRLAAPPIEVGDTFYLPLDATAAALACSAFTDPSTGTAYLTAGGGSWAIPQNVPVPILEYHAVSDDLWGIPELFVSPANMEAQLAYLVDNGYDPIWFEDLRNVAAYDKPVILTFDDGYTDNYTELFPLLQKYQVKATFFVVAGTLGSGYSMDADQVTALAASGLVSIQSHGMTHHDMQEMNEEELRYEFGESKRILTELTGAEPYAVSYPMGSASRETLDIAAEYFKFGTKRQDKTYNTSEDPLLTGRYNIARETTLDEFAAMLGGTAQ